MQIHQKKEASRSPFVRFSQGASAPFRAVKIIVTHPSLWPACLIPWLIAGALAVWLLTQANSLATGALAWLGSWLTSVTGLSVAPWFAQSVDWIFSTVGWIIVWILGWILGALLTAWLSTLVAIPFLDWLAERSERFAEPPLAPTPALQGWWSRAHWRRLKLDFWKTVTGLLVSLLGVLFSAIPVVGIAGPVILSLGLTLQFVGYAQTRRDEGVLQSLLFVARHPALSLGFGLVLLVAFAVPFFSALMLPVAVVGGTLLYAQASGSSKPDIPSQ